MWLRRDVRTGREKAAKIGSHSLPTSLHNLFIPNNLPRTDLKYDKVMPNVLFSW